jgi:ribosome maturation factor RimP
LIFEAAVKATNDEEEAEGLKKTFKALRSGIEKCIRINRALYKTMEETGMYPNGDFSLEVSSPGIDEPLKLLRQYKKNMDRNVEVITQDEVKKEGRLTGVSNEKIEIEYTEGKGKKAITKKDEIYFTDIKQTRVQIKF